MDSNTDISKWFKLLEGQKQMLQRAQSRRGQRPTDREPRDVAYAQFMMVAHSMGIKKDHMVYQSFTPPAYTPCVTPIADLSPIYIKDLQLETHHRGRCLILRTITPPNRMTAIMSLVEDVKGDVVLLMLNQQEDEEVRPANEYIGQDTILIVKEPYYKITTAGKYGVRVDHLSDIVCIKHTDGMVPSKWQPRMLKVDGASVSDMKKKGNEAIAQKRYYKAIALYTDAINHKEATELEVKILRRNRALAYLKTLQFDAALLDTEFPSFGAQPNDKSLYRAAEALYSLQRFEECCQTLELFCSTFPDDKSGSFAHERARERFNEQTTGIYPFQKMQSLARKLRPPQLEHATFIGSVEVRHTPSKGRGLFATQAIKAGDLILCEKAFCHAYAADEKDSITKQGFSKTSLLMNVETNTGFMGTQADLLTEMVQELYRNPSRAPAFKRLFHGQYESPSTPSVDGQPVVDTFLVERIMTLNVFGCPYSSIRTWNDTMMAKEVKESNIVHNSCGVWINASYINHSCYRNAKRSFIGDMMIVRATRDLEPDTEIVFAYKSSDDNKNAFEHWGFQCGCVMCLDTKGTSPNTRKQRQDYFRKLTQAVDSPFANIHEIEKLLELLHKTFSQPARVVPRPQLFDLDLTMARACIFKKDYPKTLKFLRKALEALGFDFVGFDMSEDEFRVLAWGYHQAHLVEAFQHARTVFRATGAESKAVQAEEYAKTAYKIAVGEDETYDAAYDQKLLKKFAGG